MSPTLRFQSTLLVLSRLVRMIPYSFFTRLAPQGFPSQFHKLTRLYCNGAKVVSKRLKRCYNAILVTILKYIFFPAVVSGYRGTGIGQGGAMLPSFHTMGIFIQLYGPLAISEFVGVYTPQEPAPPVVPNPNNLLEVIKVTGCMNAAVVPAFLEVSITHKS